MTFAMRSRQRLFDVEAVGLVVSEDVDLVARPKRLSQVTMMSW